MELGYIGLGKMGFNMVERLLEKGHRVVAYDRSGNALDSAAKRGAVAVDSVARLPVSLKPPSVVWIMVPHDAVDTVLSDLLPGLKPGDTVIDGGNSHYRDSMRRARDLASKGIVFLDAGVSGGPEGARSGACIMVGGNRDAFDRLSWLFRDLAGPDGWAYMGGTGAGHFVKMIHNGIEYGMMQSLAEGFAVMRQAPFGLDLETIAGLYNRRSVVESRLVGWLWSAYAQYGNGLEGISGSAAESGEGRWSVEAAKELGVAVPVIEAALAFRAASQEAPSYQGRIISALRNQFGGHDARERN